MLHLTLKKQVVISDMCDGDKQIHDHTWARYKKSSNFIQYLIELQQR